jgi:hypothetical protein
MAKMAILWVLNGDDEIEDEREFLLSDYNTKYAQIKNLAIWQDTNQDDIKTDDEVQIHEHLFDKGW